MQIIRLLDGPGQRPHLPYNDEWPPPERLHYVKVAGVEFLYAPDDPEFAGAVWAEGTVECDYRRLQFSRLTDADATGGPVQLARGAEYEMETP